MSSYTDVDIESGFDSCIVTVTESNPKPKPKPELLKPNPNPNYSTPTNVVHTKSRSTVQNSNATSDDCCRKLSLLFFMILFGLPIPFFDLYYAHTDDSCVTEQASKLAIDLKDYLLVSGWLFIVIIALVSIATCIVKQSEMDEEFFGCVKCYLIPIRIFNFAWHIVGSIIFWELMNTSNCSNSIYNYVFATLVIKLVASVIWNLS